jgi:succinoglycan biosynthesis protein ExoA
MPRATIGSLARQYFNYGKGRARTILKHREVPKLRQLIPPAALIVCALGVVLAPFTPWSLILPGVYLAVLVAASLAMAIAKRSACGLLTGVASATMHMSWSAGFLKQLLLRKA